MLEPKPIMVLLEKGSLFELNQLAMTIDEAMQSSDRIKAVHKQFQIGDVVQWLDLKHHRCYPGHVLGKHYKYLLLQDVEHTQYQHKIADAHLNLHAGIYNQ